MSSFLCPQPRVPPEHTRAFAGSLGSLCAPSRHPAPTTQLPSLLEPPPIATACPSRLGGHSSPSEGHQARVELQEETRSHSSTPSTYREPGLVTWEGGSLGPASPCHSQFCKYCHCFVGSGPTKSSRWDSLLWCRQGSREQRLNPRSQHTWQPHLHLIPLSHGLVAEHPPLPHLRPSPGSHGCRLWKGLYCWPWWGLRRQELQVLLRREGSVVS